MSRPPHDLAGRQLLAEPAAAGAASSEQAGEQPAAASSGQAVEQAGGAGGAAASPAPGSSPPPTSPTAPTSPSFETYQHYFALCAATKDSPSDLRVGLQWAQAGGPAPRGPPAGPAGPDARAAWRRSGSTAERVHRPRPYAGLAPPGTPGPAARASFARVGAWLQRPPFAPGSNRPLRRAVRALPTRGAAEKPTAVCKPAVRVVRPSAHLCMIQERVDCLTASQLSQPGRAALLTRPSHPPARPPAHAPGVGGLPRCAGRHQVLHL